MVQYDILNIVDNSRLYKHHRIAVENNYLSQTNNNENTYDSGFVHKILMIRRSIRRYLYKYYIETIYSLKSKYNKKNNYNMFN